MLCNTDFSIGHGGENDLKSHIEVIKHVDSVKRSASTQKITSYLPSGNYSVIDEKFMKVELVFSGFTVFVNITCQ